MNILLPVYDAFIIVHNDVISSFNIVSINVVIIIAVEMMFTMISFCKLCLRC